MKCDTCKADCSNDYYESRQFGVLCPKDYVAWELRANRKRQKEAAAYYADIEKRWQLPK